MSSSSSDPDHIAIQPGESEKPPRQTLADRENIVRERRIDKTGKGRKRAARPWLLPTLAALALGIIFAAYCLAGFWGVPWYLRENLPKLFAHDQRLHLDAPEIAFNPFTFTLSLGNSRINDDGENIVEIAAARAKLAPLSLLRSQLVCRGLRIDHPRIKAVLGEDHHYNLRRLFARPVQSNNDSGLLSLAELPFQFSLNNIEISDGQISLTDEIRHNEHILENVRASIPHIGNIVAAVDATVEPLFSAVFNGSPIELKGKPGRDDAGKTTQLACTIRNLEIKRYLGYLPMKFPLAITKGSAEGDLQLTFVPARGDIAIDFQLKLTDLELADDNKSVTVTAPTSHLDGVLRPMSGEIAFRNIVTHGFTVVTPNDFPWHLTQVLSTPPTDEGNSMFSRLLVDSLLADDGSLQRGDDKKNVDEWNGIDIRISKYLRAASQKKDEVTGSYSLAARHGETGGRLRFTGDFLGSAVTSGDISLEAMPLTTLWSWFGRPELASGGKANLQATLRFPDRQAGTAQPSSGLKPWLLKNGHMEAKKLALGAWFKAESLKLDGFSLSQDGLSLGKVTLVGGETLLDAAKPPEIFTASFPQLESLDYEGTLTLKNSERKLPELRFSEVKIQATDLGRAQRPGDKDNLQVQARLGDKGHINGRGNASIFPLNLTLRSDFSNLSTATILPWYTSNGFLLTVDMPLSGKGNVLLPGTVFQGDISLPAGTLTDKKTPYFSWDGLDLYGIRFNRQKHSAIIGEMALKKPRLAVAVDAASPVLPARLANFITRICAGKKDESVALEIQRISIKDGLIAYSDNRLRPQWSGNISAINGDFGAFVTDKPAQATSLQLTASLVGSSIKLSGSTAFLDGGAGPWKLSITDLPLKRFASQTGDFFGISQDGLISLDLASSNDGKSVKEEALFTGKNMTVTSPKAEAAFLLALLTNKEGNVIWRATANRPADSKPAPIFERGLAAWRDLIKRARTEPFVVAGATDWAENGAVDFVPGQAKMSDGSREALKQIGGFLTAHPLSALEVIGCADSADAQAMKKELEAEENSRVAKENARRAAAWQEELKKHGQPSVAMPEETDIPPPLPERFAPVKPQAVAIDAAVLKDLAIRRAELIRGILTNKLAVPVEQVVLGAPKIEKGKDLSQHRIVFDLHPLTAEAKTATKTTSKAEANTVKAVEANK
ncbi:MAG: DUF748 domain-containing protein [Desulfobulbaceae bacterium]|nr:DUF748 domain-containing protein [Desulfobulbaceae bacterium]